METSTLYQEVSPIDALWAIYQSQSKRVRRAFLLRLKSEEQAGQEEKRMKAYEKGLSAKERESAHQLADAVKKGVREVEKAARQGKHVGRNANDFLTEMMEDQP